MSALAELRSLTPVQRSAVAASFLGWALDAFDFFLTVFVLKHIAGDFGTGLPQVAFAITLTLAMRPVGAFIFGWLADRYGRRPVLMLDILLFSALELASAFAPSLTVFLILRALFGIAMGGEWGIGSSLVMETIPAHARGIVSGFLQQGYAVGYLLAAIAYWTLFPVIGWRGLFVLGVAPALLVIYIRRNVPESPVWVANSHTRHGLGDLIKAVAAEWKLFLYVILLMTCFNAFSHGTQDLYPTYLQQQRAFDPRTVSLLGIIASLGAIAGGTSFGIWSERIGRRRAIMLAAAGSLAVVYLWAFATSLVLMGLGAFLIQFMVQGAWGVVPVHLNELSPDKVRGTFPGFAYQLGNFVVALLAPAQAWLAASNGNNYSLALGATTAGVAVLLIIVVALGRERKGVAFGGG